MRTAEEILEKYRRYDDPKPNWVHYREDPFLKEDIITAINEARKEAIEECAERAIVKCDNDPIEYGTVLLKNGIIIRVNKDSILSLIDELK